MDEQVNLTAITSKKSASALLKTSMWMRQRCFREVGRKWCGQTFFIFQLLGMQVEISAVNKHALLSDMQVK